LEQEGVRVFTPTKDDPFLFHAKALTIQSEGRNELFLGSHNFTNAAREGRSVDLLVALQDPTLVDALADELGSSIETYGLQRYRSEHRVKKMTGVERRMHLRGMGDMYRVRTRYTHALDKPPYFAGNEIRTEDAMPFYPTQMDSNFFNYYLGQDLPNVQIYADLYNARTGMEAPAAIKRLDKELLNPGVGHGLNRIFGQEVYKDGYGVIGSAVVGAGEFIDWALGLEQYQEYEKNRTRAYSGTINKLLGLQNREEQESGFFAPILGHSYDLLASTATTLAFYVGVNLPLSYLQEALKEETLNYMIMKPEKAGVLWRGLGSLGREFTYAVSFGPTFGVVLSTIMDDPDTTRANYSQKLYDAWFDVEKVRNDPGRYGITPDGSIERIDLGEEGILGLMAGFRRFDATRYRAMAQQIFEAINPYEHGSQYGIKYTEALEDLGTTLEQLPVLEMVDAPDNPSIQEPRFRHIGTERVRDIARAYDQIAHKD
jgi:hypothetical protein